jgi:hypothetical protein
MNRCKSFVVDTDTFIGTVIDVVELKDVETQFGKQDQIRIVWVLDKNDSEGNPYRATTQVNDSVNERAKLYKIVKRVFGHPPAAPFKPETLMGRSSQLVIVKEITNRGKEFANVKVILPLPRGTTPPVAPKGFVRVKDRAKQQNQVGDILKLEKMF